MRQSVARRRCVYLALLTGLCACSTSLRGPAESVDHDGTPIVVQNIAWCNVRIFAFRGSFKHRLGMVTSMNTTRFVLPADLVDGQTIRLQISPIGDSNTFTTGPILVSGNQQVHLTVQEPIRLSTFATRRR